ncbi:hypothetical protein pb186bvf_007198 [Paramecium bursaria]
MDSIILKLALNQVIKINIYSIIKVKNKWCHLRSLYQKTAFILSKLNTPQINLFFYYLMYHMYDLLAPDSIQSDLRYIFIYGKRITLKKIQQLDQQQTFQIEISNDILYSKKSKNFNRNTFNANKIVNGQQFRVQLVT